MARPKTSGYQTLEPRTPSRHSSAAQKRWIGQKEQELKDALTMHDAGLRQVIEYFLSRLIHVSLKAGEPLRLDSLAVAMRITGNSRVDFLEAIDSRCDLVRVIGHYLQVRPRSEIKGHRSSLWLHFEATRRSFRKETARHAVGSRAGCRTLFVDITPMRQGETSLVEARGKRHHLERNMLVRYTVMKGDNQISHACIRTRYKAPSYPSTEAEVFEAARKFSRPDLSEGIFLCEPQEAAHGSKNPVKRIKPTVRPVDFTAVTAQFIVNAVKACRKGNPVMVMISDSTGALDPADLRQALLRHPLAVTIGFVYLPCASAPQRDFGRS